MFAGVRGMQMPVTFYQRPAVSCARMADLSVYEQVHNASLFSLYLPIANEADSKWAFLAAITRIYSFTIRCL